MACEYVQPNVDGRQESCRTDFALKQIMAVNHLEGVFSLLDLRKEVCNNCDPAAREQCPAYADLQKYGRSSGFCK